MTHVPPRPPAMRAAILALALLLAMPLALAQDAREHAIYLHDQGSAGPDATGRLHLVPEIIRAELGDTLRFLVTNAGSTPHNLLMCGDGEDFDEACEEKWGFTAMLQPEETATLTFEAKKPGRFDYYCFIPGHKAGMKGTLVVAGEEKNEAPLGALALCALAGAALLALRRRPA